MPEGFRIFQFKEEPPDDESYNPSRSRSGYVINMDLEEDLGSSMSSQEPYVKRQPPEVNLLSCFKEEERSKVFNS